MMQTSKEIYDEINEVESWLYKYKSIKVAIENLSVEYENSKDVTISAVDPSNEGSKTNKISRTVENVITRREVLLSRINHMKSKMANLEKALGSLNEEENKVIKNYYIEGKHYYEFSHEVGASERTCKRIKRRAIEKIRTAVFGIDDVTILAQ